MPEISLFFGTRITINYSDHVPPHFHAEYNGNKALVDIISKFTLFAKTPGGLAFINMFKDNKLGYKENNIEN